MKFSISCVEVELRIERGNVAKPVAFYSHRGCWLKAGTGNGGEGEKRTKRKVSVYGRRLTKSTRTTKARAKAKVIIEPVIVTNVKYTNNEKIVMHVGVLRE